MKKIYIATLISFFCFLFLSSLPVISSSSTIENRIGRPKDVTKEQIFELAEQIVSNLKEVISLIEDGDRKQSVSLLKLILKNISTVVIWDNQTDAVVELPEDAKASKKQIREAIRHLSKGNIDKAKPLIENALVVWEEFCALIEDFKGL